MFSSQRVMTTCQSLVSTTLKVQMSPSLISFSLQNLFHPDPPRWLQFLYELTRANQVALLLSEVLRVITQVSRSPIALQKTSGKDCKNCKHIGQPTDLCQRMSRNNVSQWVKNDWNIWIPVHVGCDDMSDVLGVHINAQHHTNPRVDTMSERVLQYSLFW